MLEKLIETLEGILGTAVAVELEVGLKFPPDFIQDHYLEKLVFNQGTLFLKDRQLTFRERELVRVLADSCFKEEEFLEDRLLSGRLPEGFHEGLKFPLRIWWVESKGGTENLVAFFLAMAKEDTLLKAGLSTLVVFKPEEDSLDYSATDVHSDLEATVYEDVKLYLSRRIDRVDEIPAGFEGIKVLRKLHGILKKNPGIYEFDKMLLSEIFYLSRREAGGGSVGRILSQVQPLDLEPELMHTAKEFLFSNLNSTDTANKLFIHRNTLLYRLGKIKGLTGYDIRNFLEAVNFYSLYLYHEFRESP
ncbi:MAG: hypothetical protein AVO33_09040 [delta proteobacterium ML8_F1]|nr:MAG: hypothetical protein AVO33_09040 [delta proteobacterium ML8_F1]